MNWWSRLFAALWLVLAVASAATAQTGGAPPRERLNIDRDWRFAMGHAHDPARDFGHATVPFFFAKAGYGDGPAAARFNDRAWQRIDVPHDWAVTLPFDRRATANHGSHAIGLGFPEHSIGWYRRAIPVTAADRGRRIGIEFDGVFRDATVWFNGHYIGREPSGYFSVRYDLTDYLDFDGTNVIAVRVDASKEEGWWYEGAGIYRHVWLTRTGPLHLVADGVFVRSEVAGRDAVVRAQAEIDNAGEATRRFTVTHVVLDPVGRRVARATGTTTTIAPGATVTVDQALPVADAALWSIDRPALHRLVTTIEADGVVVDRVETRFGIRTVRWDAATGFWLNGVNLKLHGVNAHQDHAGVGIAVPDAVNEWRLRQLKAMGVNAYRAAHNPPTPELLDAADRLGIVVIDEHRMMGTAPELTDQLTRLVRRDRNHPSVVLWSVGNEEWAIEGGEIGQRLTRRMQAHVRTLDPTRRSTVAISGGLSTGSGVVTDIAGINYFKNHDLDAYHRQFPGTPTAMTEEAATRSTRGQYVVDPDNVYGTAYGRPPVSPYQSSVEDAWRRVVERPWLSGIFLWTGFDYRGETAWPGVVSQSGMLDLTGALKDNGAFLKTAWSATPAVHLLPHWNWAGREGEPIEVWAYANTDEVELSLDGVSLGRKPMPAVGHLVWSVPWRAGRLEARGFDAGKPVASDVVETTGAPHAIRLSVDRASLVADARDTGVVTVSVVDRRGRAVPTADTGIGFAVTGAGHAIGIGNGDPRSHAPDRFVDRVASTALTGWQVAQAGAARPGEVPAAVGAWSSPFQYYPPGTTAPRHDALLLRGRYDLRGQPRAGRLVTLYLPAITDQQRVFVGGVDRTAAMRTDRDGVTLPIDASAPDEGEVVIVMPTGGIDAFATIKALGNSGAIGAIGLREPAGDWRGALFRGHAQLLVQATDRAGRITVTATAPGLAPARLSIDTKEAIR